MINPKQSFEELLKAARESILENPEEMENIERRVEERLSATTRSDELS
ncbi:Fur-regulated basic protein B [Melghiribacillus thermohalophilus]|uniref:Fur-regulated basic protein B n=1 Tax=Melghiribacillus thermohalophilus TaxID=1324956 RepID=A0A4V2V2V6_9BACI|nr:FbpB family small basic protein [Melghiribacillus thermohalophilus]TCT26651.1 Fur-regulated basic protein B [Melghiribacillus thermohalophilus]